MARAFDCPSRAGNDGDGVLDLLRSFVERVGLARGGEGKEIGFKSSDAVEPPGGVGEGLDEVGFGGPFGLVFAGEGLEVALVGVEVLGGHDDELAGESVAEGVEGGTFFAGAGFGSGGVLGIGFVDCGAGDFGAGC